MKVNASFLAKLRSSNIAIDVEKFSSKLSESIVIYSGSEGDSNECSFSTAKTLTAGGVGASQLFRVRPITASQQQQQQQSQRSSALPTSSMLSSTQTMMAGGWLDRQSSQIISSQAAPSSRPQTSARTSKGNPSYDDQAMTTNSKAASTIHSNLAVRPSAGSSSRPQTTANNYDGPSTNRSRRDSAGAITVSIYKDSVQNRLREELLQYEECEDDDEVVSIDSLPSEANDSCDEASSALPSDPFDAFLSKFETASDFAPYNSHQLACDVEEEFASETLTAEIIEKITKVSQCDFPSLRRVQLKHDCSIDSLQVLGEMLPNLREIHLNGSFVGCLRDIGTSMRNLRVIFLSRVKLFDLSGIAAFPQLIEFYASYNCITDLTELYFHENLEVIDMEGNDITSLEAVEVLETLPKLKILNIALNPVCANDKDEWIIAEKIPQLQLINDKQTKDLAQNKTSVKQEEDEEDLYESLKNLKWAGEKFLSEDVVTQLEQELQNELNEEDLLIFSVKRTSTKTYKSTAVEKKQLQQPSGNMNLTQGMFFKNPSNIFGVAPSVAAMRTTSSAFSSLNSNNNVNPFAAGKQASCWRSISSFTSLTIVSLKAEQQNRSDGQSSLVNGTDTAFCGNPLKALKHKRKTDLMSQSTNSKAEESESLMMIQSVSIPKSIVNLLEQFKHETDIDEVARLKEELKMYDFLVETQASNPVGAATALRPRRHVLARPLVSKSPMKTTQRLASVGTTPRSDDATTDLPSSEQPEGSSEIKLNASKGLLKRPVMMKSPKTAIGLPLTSSSFQPRLMEASSKINLAQGSGGGGGSQLAEKKLQLGFTAEQRVILNTNNSNLIETKSLYPTPIRDLKPNLPRPTSRTTLSNPAAAAESSSSNKQTMNQKLL